MRRTTTGIGVGIGVLTMLACVGLAAPAQASTGVDLQLQLDQHGVPLDGTVAPWTLKVTNLGTRATPGPVQVRFDYHQPVQPAAETDGGFRHMHVAWPSSADCTVNEQRARVICKLRPMAAGHVSVVTLTSVADADGASMSLNGAYYAMASTTVRDDVHANNIQVGGWGITVPR